MKLQRILAATAVATTLAAASASALASVEYDFTALSSFPDDVTGEFFTGSFSVTVPGFITSDTTIPVGSLTSCSAVSNLGAATCLDQGFLFNVTPDHVTVEFGVSSATTPNIGIFYYFDPGSFGAAGTYDTTIFGTDQQGTLVVKSTSSVPEPGSWLLMAVGMAALASRVRRQRGA